MLGNGRPFAVQLIDAKHVGCLKRDKLDTTLKFLQDEINKNTDIHVSPLVLVNAQEALKLNVGEEEKRKLYSALCYSTVPLTTEMLDKLEASTPLTLQQDTVIRVLKRRPLHMRPRDVYQIRAFKLDDYHFMLK
jgi:tRNA pseudouridine synthase 10